MMDRTRGYGRNTSVLVGVCCGECGRVSWHPDDVTFRYCARCHRFWPVEAVRLVRVETVCPVCLDDRSPRRGRVFASSVMVSVLYDAGRYRVRYDTCGHEVTNPLIPVSLWVCPITQTRRCRNG